MGIIGILAGIGIPLYAAQQKTAKEGVIVNNALSVSNMVNQLLALKGEGITSSELDKQIQVKGRKLPEDCYTFKPTTIKSSAAWAISIIAAGTICPMDAKYDSCVDSTGKITAETTTASGACTGTTDLNK